MRVIISGPVTQDHLDDADLLADIAPTSFVTNGLSAPPANSGLPTEVYPICMMQPIFPDAMTSGLIADRALIFRDFNSLDISGCSRL